MRNIKKILTFFLIFSYLFSFTQERVNREKLVFKEKSLVLNNAIGWQYNSTLGEWIDYLNIIDDDKSYKVQNNNKKEPYLASRNPQNFISIQTKVVSYKNEFYFVLLVEKWDGHYTYPTIYKDWQHYKKTFGYIFTEKEFSKLTKINKEALIKTNDYIFLGSNLEKFNESTFLDILQSYLENRSNYNNPIIFPVYKSDKGLIRFYLPYSIDWNEKGHDFTKKYFETDSSNFFKIINFGSQFHPRENVESANVYPIKEESVHSNEVYSVVDEMPIFPGGLEGLLKYNSSVKYPESSKIEGTVYIRFVIDNGGKVTNVEVARGVNEILNETAIEHVKKMPNWTPGKHKGKYVNVEYVIPVRFRIK